MKTGARSLIWPGVFALAALAILLSLGVWQLQRLAWKEGLLARLESRMAAAPVALPPQADWPALVRGDFEYRRVRATGTLLHDREVYIFRAGGGQGTRGRGPGYHVLTPLRLEGGAFVLVNRGFVPERLKDPATRKDTAPPGTVTVTGLLRAPEGRNAFTPPDKPQQRIWYTRDPEAMGAQLGLRRVAPFVIDQDLRTDLAADQWPKGGAARINIPNNHLSYALTWFGLALTLLGVFGAFAWRRMQRGG